VTVDDLGRTLKTIAEHATALRESGVTGVVWIGDIRFSLSGVDPSPMPAAAEDLPGNPLDDGDTYGGHVPQRRSAERHTDDEE
jgi:hypothetical protein